MGPDPFNMPSFGAAQNFTPMLQEGVKQAVPLATQYSGAQTGPSVQYVAPNIPTQKAKPLGVIAGFEHWLGGTASQIGHIAGGVADWLGKQTVQAVEAPFKFGFDLGTGAIRTHAESTQVDQLLAKQQNLQGLYASGKINNSQFKDGLKEIVSERSQLSSDIQTTQKRLENSKSEGIDTASDLITLVSMGAGKVSTGAGEVVAAQYLKSAGTDAFFSSVEGAVSKLAADPALYDALPVAAKAALQKATAEVVSKSAGQTAASLARATAVNLALKYPIYYNYLSSTGNQIYKELDQKKYGDAVRTTAFNAALILSGGPIGYSLSKLGKGVGALKNAAFGEKSFIDQLSKGIGNGDSAGLYNAIMRLPEADRADVIKQLSAVAETNMAATGGDATAAALRVIRGMESYEGLSLTQFSHDEALQNMVTFAKAQRLASDTADSLGLGPVTVGRVDARDLNQISAGLSPHMVAPPDTKTVYRGTGGSAKTSYTKLGDGKYVTTDPNVAKTYGPNVEKYTVSHDAKILDLKNSNEAKVWSAAHDKAEATTSNIRDQRAELSKILQSQGYHGVKQGDEHVFFDETKLAHAEAPQVDSAKSAALNAWESLKAGNPTRAWANNENFDRQIKALIDVHNDPSKLDESIRSIKSQFRVEGFPKAEAKQLSKMGYIPITPVRLEAPFREGTGPLKTAFTKGKSDFFTHAVQPLPILSHLGDALTAMGLSPNASSQRVYQIFTDNLANNLKDAGVADVGTMAGESASQTTDTLIKKLSDYAHAPTAGKFMHKLPITDLRMMTAKDIQVALDISPREAKAVQKAIAQSYLQVPMAVRGLGDRAVDLLYKAGPIAAGERRYMRLMGAGKFAYNPFFQYLRVVPKTEILASFKGGGWINSVFQGQSRELKGTIGLLRDGGFLDKAGSGAVIGQEGVDFAGETGMSRNLGKTLLPLQEKSIAGLIQAQAAKYGMDTETYVQSFPTQVRDTVQAIAEYDKKANFINSPLARTLNVAFFPFRFEAKVAGVMAKSLSQTSLMTQVSVVNGLMQAHKWLTSPEGQAWYSRNSNAIGFFEYITPLAELNNVFNSLLPGHDHSLGNFGELGGLPFGFITQMLDAQGITHFNQPFVKASTGEIMPTYVPATTKGQMAIAVQDLLGSLFSYPGAQIGLPSKTSITRQAGLGLTGGNKKTDLQLTTPSVNDLSRQQQSYIQAIQQANPQPSSAPPASPVAPRGQPQQTQVPAQSTPGSTVPSNVSATNTKLKKGQRIPQMLPGQTQLGQL